MQNVIGRAFVVVWPKEHVTGLDIPDNWKTFAAAKPVAAAAPGEQPNDPESGALFLPFLLTAGLSARSGLTFSPRGRRLRS